MKKSGSIKTILLFSGLCFLLINAAGLQSLQAQDLTMQSTTTGQGKGGSVTGTDYFSKNAMRMTSSDNNDTIIRLDTGKIIEVNNKKKTYSEITFDELQKMLDQATSAMQGMDAEQMGIMKKMMGQMSSSFSVSKAGPGETIAGYATEKWIMSGPMQGEISVAPDLKMPAAYYNALKLRMGSSPLFDMGKMVDEMRKMSGMPLKTVTTMKMMGQEIKSTKVVTSIQKGDIAPSVFEVPAGYKKVDFKR